MNSIFPNPFKQDFPKEINVIYHHKVEIINSKNCEPSRIQTNAEKVKNTVADILIALGAMMALIAGAAISFQSAGFCAPVFVVLSNFLMPGIAAILTGFHLSKKNLQTDTSFSLPTAIPGLTLKA